jgi:peptide/nickel transport system ATP-binding protein
MSPPLIEISNLRLGIRSPAGISPILRGINLSLQRGQIRGLVGESGGGKTMVGKAITGLLPPNAKITAGSIRFDDQELIGMPDSAHRRLLGRSISMILQQPSSALNPVLRIETQMVDVLRRHMGLGRAASRRRALELLDAVQIRAPDKVLRQFPHELSGGMCQRVVIAIAFSLEPSLIIADEPTTALDVTVQFQILKLIRDLQRKTGVGVLFITHDLGVVAKLCDVVSVIFGGRILEEGSAETVFANPSNPYTSALIAASPRHDQPERGLHPIPPELIARLWEETAVSDREYADA